MDGHVVQPAAFVDQEIGSGFHRAAAGIARCPGLEDAPERSLPLRWDSHEVVIEILEASMPPQRSVGDEPDRVIGVRDDGREKVQGLDQGPFLIQPIDGGVIRGRRADQEVRILELSESTQDLRESLLAQLGRSSRAGRKRSQLRVGVDLGGIRCGHGPKEAEGRWECKEGRRLVNDL